MKFAERRFFQEKKDHRETKDHNLLCVVEKKLLEILDKGKNINTLFVGCTHFAFALEDISKILKEDYPKVTIYDSSKQRDKEEKEEEKEAHEKPVLVNSTDSDSKLMKDQ